MSNKQLHLIKKKVYNLSKSKGERSNAKIFVFECKLETMSFQQSQESYVLTIMYMVPWQ